MVYGIRYTVYGKRYTVICPFLQKMKVLRIAQPGRQNLELGPPDHFAPINSPIASIKDQIQILIGIRVLFN